MIKLVVDNTSLKEKELVDKVVIIVKKTFIDNPDKTITHLAISLFASVLSKELGDEFPKNPQKRRKLLDSALQILLKQNNDC